MECASELRIAVTKAPNVLRLSKIEGRIPVKGKRAFGSEGALTQAIRVQDWC